MNWQPLDTAPRDGTWIAVYCPEAERPGIFIVQWVVFDDGTEKGIGEWSDYHTLDLMVTPTHWLPFPEFPDPA